MERIVCSAIWYDDGGTNYVHQPDNIKSGYVVCGLRHHNCVTIHAMLKGLKKPEEKPNRPMQGFLTSKNRFVDRREAMIIAKAANQVTTTIKQHELDSSDLW